MAVNGSFFSPLADAQYPIDPSALSGIIGSIVDGLNGWTVAITLFLGLVLYDQCEFTQTQREEL
jgi:sterol 22-desaturase